VGQLTVGSNPTPSAAVEITTFGLVNGQFAFPLARAHARIRTVPPRRSSMECRVIQLALQSHEPIQCRPLTKVRLNKCRNDPQRPHNTDDIEQLRRPN
jgi:hypothetical protein